MLFYSYKHCRHPVPTLLPPVDSLLGVHSDSHLLYPASRMSKSTNDTQPMYAHSAAFPPIDDALEVISRFDYKKLFNQFVTVCLFTIAIIHVIIERISKAHFSTPDSITHLVYFAVNFQAYPGDEIVGFSVGNRYAGLYSSGIYWGILNAKGVLPLR